MFIEWKNTIIPTMIWESAITIIVKEEEEETTKTTQNYNFALIHSFLCIFIKRNKVRCEKIDNEFIDIDGVEDGKEK